MDKNSKLQNEAFLTPKRSKIKLIIPPIVLLIIVVMVIIFSDNPMYTLTVMYGGVPNITARVTSEISQPTLQGNPGVRVTEQVENGRDGQDRWWKIYFTDPHLLNNPDNYTDSIEGQLIKEIKSAQKTIHIASFEFNLPRVADALIEARNNGVEIQWITDDENGIQADDQGLKLFPEMKKRGIEVKDDGRAALMHDKFWIFDNKVVWSGATNITVNGIYENNNNTIVIDSPELATIYENQFLDMWSGNFGPDSPSDINSQRIRIEETDIQIIFSPEDHAIAHLIPLIEQAKKKIRIMAFSFTHDALGKAVIDRSEAGVDVAAIFETRGSETKFSELKKMWCAKVPVRQDGNPSMYHHKVFVIDDKIVITGSLNFSNNADQNNNENVLILINPAIATTYLDEFERTWAEAREPHFKYSDCK